MSQTPSRGSPTDRLQKKLVSLPEIDPNASDNAIDRSIQKGITISSKVGKRFGYRTSIGHLGEDKGHRSMKSGFLLSNPNKHTNSAGFDRVYLRFNKIGQMVILVVDDKAHQLQAKIYQASAVTKNLKKNLVKLQKSVGQYSRDQTRTAAERLLYRSAYHAIRNINKNIAAAVKNGLLQLKVSGHGGNATGVGPALEKQGVTALEGSMQDSNSGKQQVLKNRMVGTKIAKRFGISREVQISQKLSREAKSGQSKATSYKANIPISSTKSTLKSSGQAGGMQSTLSSNPLKPGKP